MNTRRSMTRSPAALARMALRVSRETIPCYSSRFSRHDFTQQQLFAMLVLKIFFKTDYRGIVAYLRDMPELCSVLELKKLPHYSTLKYAHDRLLKKGLSIPSSPAFSVLPTRPT